MKKPKLKIETIGGPALHFDYGWSSGKLFEQGKIGIGFNLGNDAGCVITPESVDDLIKFLIVCQKLFCEDNNTSMRNLRKRNKQWYADSEMEERIDR